MSIPGEEFAQFDISVEEKDKLVREVIRYVLFKTEQSSGCPIKREDLTQLVTGKNYRQRNLPDFIINEARRKLEEIFGYEMKELQRACSSTTNRFSQQEDLWCHLRRLGLMDADESHPVLDLSIMEKLMLRYKPFIELNSLNKFYNATELLWYYNSKLAILLLCTFLEPLNFPFNNIFISHESKINTGVINMLCVLDKEEKKWWNKLNYCLDQIGRLSEENSSLKLNSKMSPTLAASRHSSRIISEVDNFMTVANPRQFKDYKDSGYSQVVSNALDMKLRDDLERLKMIRNHRVENFF